MSESNDQILANITALLAGYPKEEQLFGRARKFVLFLGSSSAFQNHLYIYLVDRLKSIKPSYRMVVPVWLYDE
jgi:hypothetical protein